jgi:putative FmdB family regulatory protein
MPSYEQKCLSCGAEFEVERSIKDDSDVPCPECGAESTERQISLTSFSLKGGGWFGGAGCKTPASEVDKAWLSHFEGQDPTKK